MAIKACNFLLVLMYILTEGTTTAAAAPFDNKVYTGSLADQTEFVPLDLPVSPRESSGSVRSRSKFLALDSKDFVMPMEIFATLKCRKGSVNLNLRRHTASTRQPDETEVENNLSMKGNHIPVYTRHVKGRFAHGYREGSSGSSLSEIVSDNFTRDCADNCKTYRDENHQAVLLVIKDARSNSYRFLGSLAMEGRQYFIQPFATGNPYNSSTSRNMTEPAHTMEEVPRLDFSVDSRMLFMMDRKPGQTKENPIAFETQNTGDGGDGSALINQTSGISPTSVSNKSAASGKPSTDSVQHSDQTNFPTRKGKGRQEQKDRIPETFLRKRNKHWYHPDVEVVTPEPVIQPTTTPDPAVDELVVEIFIVCDFLCYQRFQGYYSVVDPVKTKNSITQYFAYVQEFQRSAYGGLVEAYPELGLSVEVKVVGLYIATQADDKIIGDYVIGDNREVDSTPTLFEFALWVEDSLKPSLKADHYALVTGYDMSGESNFILGLVTNIPSMCQLDSVSVSELWLPVTASIMTHELGHSLGAEHDGLTNGFCQDEQQFIMAAIVGGPIPEENLGNNFRFSNCSALFFKAALPERECLRHETFPSSSSLPHAASPVGQEFTLDEQCAAFFNESVTCRENITKDASNASWDGICSNNLCTFPSSEETLCFEMTPLHYTSCGNRRWCVNGMCVEDSEAPEKPVDCPAGDSAELSCDPRRCRAGSYDDITRFITCCHTCQPIKTERFVVISRSNYPW